MLERLNHVAIAVPDIKTASALYSGQLGAKVTAPQALPEHGVTVVFIDVGNTKIELLEPLGERSPIASFLERTLPAVCIIFAMKLQILSPLVTILKRKAHAFSVTASQRSVLTESPYYFCIPRTSMGH